MTLLKEQGKFCSINLTANHSFREERKGAGRDGTGRDGVERNSIAWDKDSVICTKDRLALSETFDCALNCSH